MNKVYSRINWKNAPKEDTPLNETNLNRMDYALDSIDDRVVEFDTTKASVSSIQNYVASWTMNETTGVITVTKVNGEQITFDLNIEKIPVNFTLSDAGVLTMTTADGSTFTADISSMIHEVEFEDSDAITVAKQDNGKYKASVKNNSITDDMIEAEYLANVRLASTSAQSSSQSASADANLSKSYAVGGTGTRTGEDTDNAKYYYEQTKGIAGGDFVTHAEVGTTVASLENGTVPTTQLPTATSSAKGLVKPDGTTITVDEDGTIHSTATGGVSDYDELDNKPSINGHELTGNQTASDLGLFSGDYNDLENKPTIPSAYELPIANSSTLGGVKPDGTTTTVDENGVISAVDSGGGSSDWELIGSTTGKNKLYFSIGEYKEFYIKQGSTSHLILASMMSNTQNTDVSGGYYSSSNYVYGEIGYTNSYIYPMAYVMGTSNLSLTTVTTMYGRK